MELILGLAIVMALGAAFGVIFMAIPATIIGGLLWKAAMRDPRLERAMAWILAGAATGIGAHTVYGAGLTPFPLRPEDSAGNGPVATVIVFAVSGAAAALMYRATMRALTGYSPTNDEP